MSAKNTDPWKPTRTGGGVVFIHYDSSSYFAGLNIKAA
jgi:hypothetical protein